MQKKIAGTFCVALIAILLFTMQTTVTSCSKTETIIDTVTKIQIDTLQEQDTMLTTAILVANPWKLQELYGSDAGVIDHYLRGGTSNTVNFDNEYMTFAANGTGVYTANTGIQSTYTWNFTDATNQTMEWHVDFGYGLLDITWANIKYDDGQLRYTEFYVLAGNKVLGEGIRIPK